MVRIKGKRTLSSRMWLSRQLNDPYVKEAKKRNFRCRAVFKLMEIEEKFRLISSARYIVDLGAAPGGWSQLLSERSHPDANIVAVDLLQFDELPRVKAIIGDFEDESIKTQIHDLLGSKADLIVSDMAPATTGNAATDHLRIVNLMYTVIEFSKTILSRHGNLVMKIFHGGEERKLVECLRQHFSSVHFFKPKASRSESAEIYLIALGFLQ